MESIVEFPDREIIEDEALSWLIRLDGDQSLSPKAPQAPRPPRAPQPHIPQCPPPHAPMPPQRPSSWSVRRRPSIQHI